MSDHALLAPSAAARWIRCPGSIRMSRGIPDTTSEYAEEGRRAHAVAEEALQQACDAETAALRVLNEPLADAWAVDVYLDYVRKLPAEVEFIEQRVELSPWSEHLWGTADFIAVADKHMHVCDYKHGQGVLVEADGNEQAKCYALGAWHKLNFIYEIEDITVHIIQPRAKDGDGISSWTISTAQLLEWADNTLKPAAQLAITDTAPLNPSDTACKWCPAQSSCPALAELSFSTAVEGFEPVARELRLRDVTELTPEQCGQIMTLSSTVINFFKEVEKRVYLDLEKGHPVPGWKRVLGNKGARKWSDEAQADTALRKLARAKGKKVGEIAVKKPISPTQAEKLFGKDGYSVLTEFVTQDDAKPTLAPISDNRPAIVANPLEGLENLENKETET